MNVIKWIQKKSKKSEKKYKNRSLNYSDDQMYPEINNEQTPEYLSAIAQFLERSSSAKVSTNEENTTSINSHSTTANKVKFAKKDSSDQTNNEKNSINEEVVGRSFCSLSKKTSTEDMGESTFSNSKFFQKNNGSRTENKNTSSSVNYEKFQTGKINDSFRKDEIVPSTSFEVSSDSNFQPKANINTLNKNNLNSSQIAEKTNLNSIHSSLKIDTTDSNTSVFSNNKGPKTLLKKSTKMNSCSVTKANIEPSNLGQKKSSSIGLTTSKQNSDYIKTPSLSKEDSERINGFIKYTGRQSVKENSQMEFTSYVPFIPFKELKWHKNSLKTDFGWYCEWRKPSWNDTSVLIRRIKSSTMLNSNILISEINALSSIRHPNILVLMGYTFDSGDYLMPIYQYFRHSLHCHLHEMACALSLPKIIKIVLQITEALSFAHMMGIIHTTVSSHCIALSDDFNNAKIFGFDYSVSTNSGTIAENIGRKQWYQWLAPELFDSPPNVQVSLDVYSLCVVLWECCYLTIPWKNISYAQLSQIYTKWRMGIPLTNNRYLPTEVYHLLKTGFQIDPKRRNISLTEIMSVLKDMQKQFQNGENIFLFTSVEQLSSQMNFQKVIIKKYITPENIYQQLSTTTPSPKSISTNESPQDNRDVLSKDSEEVQNIPNTPKTSKSKLLHKIMETDQRPNNHNQETKIDEDIIDATQQTKCTNETEIDNNIIDVIQQDFNTINLEKIPKFFNKQTEITEDIVNEVQQTSHKIIIPTVFLGNSPQFCSKGTSTGEDVVDLFKQTSNTTIIPTLNLENSSPKFCKKTQANEHMLQLASHKIDVLDNENKRIEIDEGSLQTTSNKNMILKNNLQNEKSIDGAIHISSTISTSKLNHDKNLNQRLVEDVSKNFDIKKRIYEYEILTKHLHDTVVPRVNFDRTKLYIRNTDIKPASHRTTIIEVPVTKDSTEYLMEKKKKNSPTFKLSVVQQKRLCIDELKNFFEHYLWKKEKNKCLQITHLIPFQKIKNIENTNFQNHKKVKKSKLKLCQLKEKDNYIKLHFIEDIINEIIDAVVCSENKNLEKYKTSQMKCTNQEVISYNLKNFEINCLRQNIQSLKEYEIQQQKIYSQMKRTLDILNFYINLNNTSLGSPIVQTFCAEELTTIDVQKKFNEYRPFMLFKSPNFMNYWQNILRLYITTQLKDVYIDDDFTSDAVQLTSDLTEFYVFVDQQEKES